MVRTSILGQSKVVKLTSGTTELDTKGYGSVTIVIDASVIGDLTATDSDGTSFAAAPDWAIVDGEVDEAGQYLAAYIGNKRYVKFSFSGTAALYAILSEARNAE